MQRSFLQSLCKEHKTKMGDVKCNSTSANIQKKLEEIGVLEKTYQSPEKKKNSRSELQSLCKEHKTKMGDVKCNSTSANIQKKLEEIGVLEKTYQSPKNKSSPKNKPSYKKKSSPKNKPSYKKKSSPKNKPSYKKKSSPKNKPSYKKKSSPKNKPSYKKKSSPKNKPSYIKKMNNTKTVSTKSTNLNNDILFKISEYTDDETWFKLKKTCKSFSNLTKHSKRFLSVHCNQTNINSFPLFRDAHPFIKFNVSVDKNVSDVSMLGGVHTLDLSECKKCE